MADDSLPPKGTPARNPRSIAMKQNQRKPGGEKLPAGYCVKCGGECACGYKGPGEQPRTQLDSSVDAGNKPWKG